MADPDVILDFVNAVSEAIAAINPSRAEAAEPSGQAAPNTDAAGKVTVGDRQLSLPKGDRGRVYENVFVALRAIASQVYVEVAPDNEVGVLHVPIVGRVLSLQDGSAGDVRVRLSTSATCFVLKPAHPKRQETLDTLKEAVGNDAKSVALVHLFNSTEILYVQKASPVTTPAISMAQVFRRGAGVLRSLKVLEDTRELDAFVSEMSQQASCPIPVTADCIPFNYVLDGCWMRAHEMCERLNARGLPTAKLWVYAPQGQRLRARTQMLPNCQTDWFFHVAPLARVRGQGLFVVDPSMFPERAVPKRDWIRAMNVERPPICITEQKVYQQVVVEQPMVMISPPDMEVAPLDQNERELIAFRGKLSLLTTDKNGPPPYAQCSI